METIDRLEDFDALRSSWEALHTRDPQAHVFSSWGWQRAHWEVSPYAPFVAAVRHAPSGEYVAFAPLAREKWPALRVVVGSALRLGGSPKADYTGLVADPAHEAGAIEALAAYIDALRWTHAFFDDVRDVRYERIIESLGSRGNVPIVTKSVPCVFIPLGGDFEAYLGSVSKRFRGKIRHALRSYERIGAKLERATDSTVDARITTLIRFHHLRWGGNLTRGQERFGKLFRNAYNRGCLQIFTLERDEEVLAAVAVFLCAHDRAYLAYMTGINPAFSEYAPGVGLHALVIQHAIANHYELYDFTRGRENYKLHFGVQERATRTTVVARSGIQTSAHWMLRCWLDSLKGVLVRIMVAVRRPMRVNRTAPAP